MANPIATFGSYFQDLEDPYDPIGSLYTAFAVGGQNPAQLMASIKSSIYPLPLLLAGMDHAPLVAVAPFSRTVLPGADGGNLRFAFCRDVTGQGALPGLVTIDNAVFHQAAAVPVLAREDMEAAFAALAATKAGSPRIGRAASVHTPCQVNVPATYLWMRRAANW